MTRREEEIEGSCALLKEDRHPAKTILNENQKLHRFEGHHFALFFAPYFLVWENSGFIQENLRRSFKNSRTSHRKGGSSGTGKGPILVGEIVFFS